MMQTIGVPSKDLSLVWPKVKDMVTKAIEHSDGKFNTDDLYKLLQDKACQLWVAYNHESKQIVGVAITEIIVYPNEKRLNFFVLTGTDFAKLYELSEPIYAFARAHNCKKADVIGRPGWEKVLAPYGFKKIHTIVSIDL